MSKIRVDCDFRFTEDSLDNARKDIDDIAEKASGVKTASDGKGSQDSRADSNAPTPESATRKLLEESHKHQDVSAMMTNISNSLKGMTRTFKDVFSKEETATKEDKTKTQTYMSLTSSGITQLNTLLKGSLRVSLNILQSIYGRMKAASPLLQAMESLFQLAMTLFFMPLGNKLAEVLIPTVIRLLDTVMAFWGSLEGKSLGAIFSSALNEGIKILGGYFYEIGAQLENEGGILGSIGRLFVRISDLLTGSGMNILNHIVNLLEFVVSHARGIITAIVALGGLHYTLMLANMAVTASSARGILSKILGGMAVIAGSVTAAASLITFNRLSSQGGTREGMPNYPRYAKGGYVPATAGGQLSIIGEGGEGEYITPESKISGIHILLSEASKNIARILGTFEGKLLRDILRESFSKSSYIESKTKYLSKNGGIPRENTGLDTLSSKKSLEIKPEAKPMSVKIDIPPVKVSPINISLTKELQVPSKKDYPIKSVSNNTNANTVINNFYIEGVTSEELGRMIDDRISEQISLSKYRSVF